MSTTPTGVTLPEFDPADYEPELDPNDLYVRHLENAGFWEAMREEEGGF